MPSYIEKTEISSIYQHQNNFYLAITDFKIKHKKQLNTSIL